MPNASNVSTTAPKFTAIIELINVTTTAIQGNPNLTTAPPKVTVPNGSNLTTPAVTVQGNPNVTTAPPKVTVPNGSNLTTPAVTAQTGLILTTTPPKVTFPVDVTIGRFYLKWLKVYP